MSDKVYNILKYITMYVLAPIGLFYTAIATIWGLPFASEVPATIVALETLLAAILGISSVTYTGSTETTETAEE